jgi:hypothetical protein
MAAIKGKEVRKTIENSLLQSLKRLDVSKPTKKAMKVIRKASKEIGNKLKRELKGKKS